VDINKKQWYVRWFFFCLALIDEFVNERGWRMNRFEDGVNLCTFMRVSLIWGPLVILLHITFYTGLVATFTYLPIHLFGFGGYVWIIGSVAGVIGALFLVAWVEDVWKIWRRKRWEAAREARHKALEFPVNDRTPEAEKKGPSFVSVVWSYAAAVKQKVCPIIKFN
jgi:hypothetical protein